MTPPSWLKDVTPDEEVMAAFYKSNPPASHLKPVEPLVAGLDTLPAPPSQEEILANSPTEQYGTVRNSTEQYGTPPTLQPPTPSFNQTIENQHFTYQPPIPQPSPSALSATYGTVRNSTEQYGTSTQKELFPLGENKRVQPLQPVSVQRDYNKRPNSLERDAVPLGLFPGTTKVLYDILFQRSRGAVEPTRLVQLSSANLIKLARLSEKTLWRHLTYLENTGLIARRMDLINEPQFDKKGGNIYEVFIPEEINLERALLIAKDSKLNEPGKKSFPQGNSTEQYSTVRNNVPGTVRNNVPYLNSASSLESTNAAPLRHVRHTTEEESAAARLTGYLSQIFNEQLGRELTTEERLGIFATLTEELLDLVHIALQANGQYGQQPIENPVAWFTAMIGQRLAGRNRKRSPEESLRAAVWVTLREIEREHGGRITAEERDDVELELMRRLVPKYNQKMANPARFIKEQITSWWMMIKPTGPTTGQK
ncbi:MAG: hypothetical protein K1Y36_09470 [Blastocatellia bacterium]|nr:hypothetical protein [Blastocatellia bacterium]